MVQPLQSAQRAIQFQFLAEIATGDTARVDLCRATSPPDLAGRLLAVKRLHQHIAEDPSFANQFLDEVWMTAALKHPNVVEMAGWGTDDQGMYLAMELVQGVSLARLMKTVFDTGDDFSERQVVYIGSQLCRGLAAAHGLAAPNGELLHLVHRDLTPGNVLMGFRGDVKITDFGLAKAKQRLTKTLTGLLRGQPQYMAPEQARGEHIDQRTDLFAFGVLLFELFAKRKPWRASSDYEAVQSILTEAPDDLRDLRPQIDKELANVVSKCLEKDPAHRFQQATEIQARLDEWLQVHGYREENAEALGRFVRRNAMKQMRWFEAAVTGSLIEGRPEPPRSPSFTGAGPAVRVPAMDDDDDDDGDATDVTDVESMVDQMQQRAADPATARRMVGSNKPQVVAPAMHDRAQLRGPPLPSPALDDADYAEEVPTIVQKSGKLPLPPPGARPAAPPQAQAPSAQAPHRPPQKIGAPTSPAAPRNKPPSAAPPHRPPAPPARSAAPPLARPIHDSIIDEDSDARTTAVKTQPRPAASAQKSPQILGLDRKPVVPQTAAAARAAHRGSIADPESEEVPTVPLQSVPGARSSQGAAARPPGHLAPADPRVPSPPSKKEPLPSLDDDEGDFTARRPMTDERLFAEADRLALEAVRFNDEAKHAAARAERQAVISKIANDAAAIAVEAVRIASTSGLGEAARRLEDAYALERTVHRLIATPLDVPAPPSMPHSAPPSAAQAQPARPAFEGALDPHRAQRAPAYPAPPSSSPGAGGRTQPLDPGIGATAPLPPTALGTMQIPQRISVPPPSVAPPSMSAPMSIRPEAPSLPGPSRLGPASAGPAGVYEAQVQSFEERLRPTLFGLPGIHVAALAIGTFVLVLLLMWLLMG